MRPAVFLDRDGTLIYDTDYVRDPEKVVLIPGVPETLFKLRDMGYLLVVVSNQSGIARGYFREESVRAVNNRINELIINNGGAAPAAYYFCPHFPEGTIPEYAVECRCRKPKPGMVNQAVRELDIDLANSAIVGDTVAADIELGRALGITTVYFNIHGVSGYPEDIAGATSDFTEIPEIILKAKTAPARPKDLM
ncbi:MAG: HAD family hydrolase [bacterium]|jgi:histidinol-phosphate phosphatase family protein